MRLCDYNKNLQGSWVDIFNFAGPLLYRSLCICEERKVTFNQCLHAYFDETTSDDYTMFANCLESRTLPEADTLIDYYSALLDQRHSLPLGRCLKACISVAWSQCKSLLLLPDNIMAAWNLGGIHYTEQLAYILAKYTFTYQQLLNLILEHSIRNCRDNVYSVYMRKDNLVKCVASSVCLQGKRTPFGYAMARCDGAIRYSTLSGEIVYEAPELSHTYKCNNIGTYKVRDTNPALAEVLLLYINTLPMLHPIGTQKPRSDYAGVDTNRPLDLCKHSLNNGRMLICNDNKFFYDDHLEVFTPDGTYKGVVYTRDITVSPEKQLKQARYLYGVGDITKTASKYTNSECLSIQALLDHLYED